VNDLDTSLGEPGGQFPKTAHDFLQGLREPGGSHLISLEGALPSHEEEWNGLFGG
jgi:hypothetical protein